MTTEELNTIVSEVMAQIEANALDFDIMVSEAQDNDYLTVARYDESNGTYRGLVITWKDVAKVVTDVAVQAKTDAVNAKDIAQQILSNVTAKGTEITNFVATSKSEIATAKIEAVNAVKNVYQTDLNAERSARQSADTDHTARIAALESENARQKGEIENLKAKANGQIYREEIVEAEAYSIDVPSSSAPYAEVQMIGGKSVVWNQLFNLITSQYTSSSYINYCSSFIEGNYLKIISGTDSKWNVNFYPKRFNTNASHKYFLTVVAKADSICNFYFGFDSYTYSYNLTTNETLCSHVTNGTDTEKYIYISGDINHTFYVRDIKTIDLTLMFGSGNEPDLETCKKIFSADYYPYDAGSLKSFPVKKVKSIGRNMVDLDSYFSARGGSRLGDNEWRIVADSNMYEKANALWSNDEGYSGQITICAETCAEGSSITFPLLVEYTDGNYVALEMGRNGSYKKVVFVSNSSKTVEYVGFLWNTSGASKYKNIMVAKGVYDSFSPYKVTTLDLSSVTTDMKSALNSHDEWSNGKVTKRIGVVDLGSINWIYVSSGKGRFQSATIEIKNPSSSTTKANVLCQKYEVQTADNIYLGTLGIAVNSSTLWVYDLSYTDASTFKSAMSGVMLYYELATPTESEVPEIANFIQVEGGGTLTFESDDTIHMPVPSTDRFVVDLT